MHSGVDREVDCGEEREVEDNRNVDSGVDKEVDCR